MSCGANDEKTLSNHVISVIDESYSVQEIIKEHLYGEIIPRTRRAAKGTSGEKLVLNALQKCIWNGWPEETKLSKMENGKLN